MNYIIIDLEWNTAYSKKKKKFVNEIIEIGAVKLNGEFKGIDYFTSFVSTVIEKRLKGTVKELTHISNEDIKGGDCFLKVMSEFSKWIGSEESVIMSWGNSDIFALMENYEYFTKSYKIPFLKRYCDMQAYSDDLFHVEKGKQLGLSAVSERLQVFTKQLDMHRGLSDSIVAAQCFRELFDKEMFQKYCLKCDDEFYDRLRFKPYTIKNIHNKNIDKSQFITKCPDCHTILIPETQWKCKNTFFRSQMFCEKCEKRYKVSVRFKVYYDGINVKKKVEIFNPKPNSDCDKKVNSI